MPARAAVGPPRGPARAPSAGPRRGPLAVLAASPSPHIGTRLESTPFRASGVAARTLPGASCRSSVVEPLMRATTTRTHRQDRAAVEQIKSKLDERGIRPASEVAAPSLYGVLYSINGKAVLSLKVEPYLYADRAGSFVSALQSRSTKARSIIFTGTAGALDQSMEIGDLVAPGSFAQTDALVRTPVADVSNQATDILDKLAFERGDSASTPERRSRMGRSTRSRSRTRSGSRRTKRCRSWNRRWRASRPLSPRRRS